MKYLLLATLLVFGQTLFGQDTTRILIPAGKRPFDVITPAMMYRYKEFKPGQVLFNDGNINNARLNYNLLNGEVMFIAPAGDTLVIAKQQALNIKRVSIDTSVYVYNKGYLEVMRENKIGILARKQQYFVVNREKIGAYDMASSISSIDSYSSISDPMDSRHDLVVRENVLLQLKTAYYVGDPYRLLLPLNRKNLEKVFFSQRNNLESYLKDHQVDFQNEKQLTSLFIFLTDTP